MSRNLIALQQKLLGSGDNAFQRLQRLSSEGKLSEDALRQLAADSGLPGSYLTSLASFYDDFRVRGAGQHVLRICRGSACYACGGEELLAGFEQALGITEGETSADRTVTLTSVNCLGFCGVGPAIECDGVCVKAPAVASINEFIRESVLRSPALEKEAPDQSSVVRPLTPLLRNHVADQACFGAPTIALRNVARSPQDFDSARAAGIYESFQNMLSGMTPEQVIHLIEKSALRGRGGDGVETGLKLRKVFEAQGRPKYVVVNGNEGDPGSYIDKELIEHDPHSILEGLLIAAFAVGATEAYIYICGEYKDAFRIMDRALTQTRDSGMLGRRSVSKNRISPGFQPKISLVKGAGAYICGEQTALLRSIEGLPPLVSASTSLHENGLYDLPTLVINVETLQNLPWILRHGAAAYAAIGSGKSRGTKAVSLSSRFARPGVYEVPFGVSLRQLVEEVGGGVAAGHRFKALQIGGPLGGIFPESLLDTPFTFEGLAEAGGHLGHGGVVLFTDEIDMLDLARHAMEFCALESCGKCVPCRMGSFHGVELLRRMRTEAVPADRVATLKLLKELMETMRYASLCGLGSATPNPVESIFKYFLDEA